MSAVMPQRFPYLEADPLLGSASALPYAPITLHRGDRNVQVSALIEGKSRTRRGSRLAIAGLRRGDPVAASCSTIPTSPT